SAETTFDDVIKGVQHKWHDPIDDVMQFIEDNEFYPQNVKDVLLNSIQEGIMVEWPDEKELLLKALPELGLPAELESRMALAIQTESKVELPAIEQPDETVVKSGDKGLDAGMLLLKKTREAIGNDASAENRMRYTTVLYAFLRLLMCDAKTEIVEVAESLETRASKAEGAVKELLEESIRLLRA
ncbi:MAG: hypothetical protein NC548_30675, partial [Lachnospiraceae bacterium]|nr:hypothetical protein [Lachnospiraceae bacterium]